MSISRRDFLRNCALIAAGAVAVDQIDLLEKVRAGSRAFFMGMGLAYDFQIRFQPADGGRLRWIGGYWDKPISMGVAGIAGPMVKVLRMPAPYGWQHGDSSFCLLNHSVNIAPIDLLHLNKPRRELL